MLKRWRSAICPRAEAGITQLASSKDEEGRSPLANALARLPCFCQEPREILGRARARCQSVLEFKRELFRPAELLARLLKGVLTSSGRRINRAA
jgi:hypothetical protein